MPRTPRLGLSMKRLTDKSITAREPHQPSSTTRRGCATGDAVMSHTHAYRGQALDTVAQRLRDNVQDMYVERVGGPVARSSP